MQRGTINNLHAKSKVREQAHKISKRKAKYNLANAKSLKLKRISPKLGTLKQNPRVCTQSTQGRGALEQKPKKTEVCKQI